MSKPIFNSLQFRLTLAFSVVAILLSSIGFLFLYLSLEHYLYTKIDDELYEDFEEIAEVIEESSLIQVQENFDEESQSDDPEEMFYRLVDNNGTILAKTDLETWPSSQLDHLSQSIPSQNSSIIQTITIRDDENTTRIISGKLSSNQILQIGFVIDDEIELLQNIIFYSIIILICTLFIAYLIGYYISNMAVSGINNVTQTAELITAGDLNKRVTVPKFGIELENLGNSFNKMTDRVTTLIKEMNELVDNIAHDIRIPITRMRGISEEKLTSKQVSDDCANLCEDVIEECDNLLHITNTMLDISELDSGLSKMVMEEFDLYPVIKQVTDSFQPVIEDQNMHLEFQSDTQLSITGDKRKLQRTLANLIDNAIKYNLPNGKIRVHAINGNNTVKIKISDTGIGIHEKEIIKIFQRFYRCSKSRNQPGNGLGLCFAQSVIRAHEGQIHAESTEGKGTTFTLTFPSRNNK